MHEVGIARTIIESVEERLRRGEVRGKVRAVHLRVGRMSSVVPESLRFGFEVLSKDSVLQGARLEIEEVPVRARCRACGEGVEIDEPCFLCGKCGSPDLEVLSGTELLIDSLDVEEPS
jgi:hydrogenase nickel incorporation protein HypA/HybF